MLYFFLYIKKKSTVALYFYTVQKAIDNVMLTGKISSCNKIIQNVCTYIIIEIGLRYSQIN